MPNYNPKIDHLSAYPKVYSDRPMGNKTITVRVLEEDYVRFKKIPTKTRNKMLRDYIHELGIKFEQEDESKTVGTA